MLAFNTTMRINIASQFLKLYAMESDNNVLIHHIPISGRNTTVIIINNIKREKRNVDFIILVFILRFVLYHREWK